MSTGTTATRYDKWLFKTMNDSRTKRYHATRRMRRRIVVAHIAATAVGAAGMAGSCAVASPWPLAAVLLGLVAWIPLMGLINSMNRGMLELRRHLLDERQLAERGTVHVRTHRIVSAVMTVAVCGFWGAWAGGSTLDGLVAPLAAAGFVVLLLHWMLPHWIAALRVQDEPEDDDVRPRGTGADAPAP